MQVSAQWSRACRDSRCHRKGVPAMKTKLLNASAVIALAVAGGAIAASNPMVGGAPMLDNKNIIQNAVNSKDHTTLAAAVKAGGLADTLQGPGPFYRVRTDQRSFRRPACRDRGYAVEAREQGYARQDPHLSRRTRPLRFGDA